MNRIKITLKNIGGFICGTLGLIAFGILGILINILFEISHTKEEKNKLRWDWKL